jgi:glycosyltransferase involved in cell wall biosynthesis
MKLLSIIIPVYNVEKYIADCLESVFNQGLEECEFEVIIVNDGTLDNSMRVIGEIIEEHNNIIIINQPNQGVSIARNAGLSKATGEYIYFVDPDDVLIDNCLSVLVSNLKGTNVDILMADYMRFNDGDNIDDVIHSAQDYSALEKSGVAAFCEDLSPYECYVWRLMIRREFLLRQKIEFKPFRYEDILFCQECYLKAGRCVKASFLLYCYRYHSGAFTSSMNIDGILDVNSAIAGLWNLRGVGNARNPIVGKKLMDNIFCSFSFCLWCISHNEQLYVKRRIIVSDLKEKVNSSSFVFTGGIKQRAVSYMYRYFPYLYLRIRHSFR